MKKFIFLIFTVLLALLIVDKASFDQRLYWNFGAHSSVTFPAKAQSDQILLHTDEDLVPFEIRGVNLNSSLPGHWSTDFVIDKKTYLRWFDMIQEMGANTIRVHTVQTALFYDALLEFNQTHTEPLYLLQGVWVNDYVQKSHRNAWDSDIYEAFSQNCRDAVDAIHGKRMIRLNTGSGYGHYHSDVSPWTIGYILGPEWEPDVIVFTNEQCADQPAFASYHGEYLSTTEDASPFEAMLAAVGDRMIEYETMRFQQQRPIAFCNSVLTDPFCYPTIIAQHFSKYAQLDTEHIQAQNSFPAGLFAAYHVYPGYPNYLRYMDDWTSLGIQDSSGFLDSKGNLNTYRAYLSLLTNHHTVPVIIAEYGASTSRGRANDSQYTTALTEQEQGQMLVQCYDDIHAVGCAGSCVSTWQDEWYKRTWNTMYSVDLSRTPYWSDTQTYGQFFGLLAMDPGKDASICVVDGCSDEWSTEDLISENDIGQLYMKYDARHLYLMIRQDGMDLSRSPLYIPFDITPKSGSYFCESNELRFDRPVDFLLVLNGIDQTRLLVQQRYEALRSTYAKNVYGIDAYITDNIPDVDTPVFVPIYMMLMQRPTPPSDIWVPADVYETGKLTYGNTDPQSPNYNSLADFYCGNDVVEIRIPWQMLNFLDPSLMEVHDDYYSGHYGVERLPINNISLGLTDGSTFRAELVTVPMSGWGESPDYHERLKPAYYMLKQRWEA